MLGLPKTTELNKQLSKKAIYTKFQMNTAAKEKIDADISRITIVNEVSSERVNIAEGEQVKSFFILLVNLKKKEFDERNIAIISKLIPQNILFVLECGDEQKLAVYHTKFMQTEWQPKDNLTVQLKGLNLDAVWENIIMQIGSIEIQQGKTLDEQIADNDRKQKLLREIARYEKLARNERQPKKKYELVQKIKILKQEMEKN